MTEPYLKYIYTENKTDSI